MTVNHRRMQFYYYAAVWVVKIYVEKSLFLTRVGLTIFTQDLPRSRDCDGQSANQYPVNVRELKQQGVIRETWREIKSNH